MVSSMKGFNLAHGEKMWLHLFTMCHIFPTPAPTELILKQERSIFIERTTRSQTESKHERKHGC